MATGPNPSPYSVKISNLPKSIPKRELENILGMPADRVVISQTQFGEIPHAYVHGFEDEREANRFVNMNKGTIIFDKLIEFQLIIDGQQSNLTTESSVSDTTLSIPTTLTTNSQSDYNTNNHKSDEVPLQPTLTSSRKSRMHCKFARTGQFKRQPGKCEFLHEDCPNSTSCSNPNCQLTHSDGVKTSEIPCLFGDKCRNSKCEYKHAENTIFTSTEIYLSNARIHFLQSIWGKKVLKSLEEQKVIFGEIEKKGDECIEVKQCRGQNVKTILERLLFEERLIIPRFVTNCLQISKVGKPWKDFLEKYRIGFSLVFIEKMRNNNNLSSSDDSEISDDDERRNVNSMGRSQSANRAMRNNRRDKRMVRLTEITLCSDSHDSLSEALRELRSYSSGFQRFTLQQQEVNYILRQSRPIRPNEKRNRFHDQMRQIRDYLLKTISLRKNNILSINIKHPKGNWIVEVKGLEAHVKNAVSMMKSMLMDNVETEEHIPISSAMSRFLRSKASTSLKGLEKNTRTKIDVLSKRRTASGKTEDESDNYGSLKIVGGRPQVTTGKSKLEDFLETLSEQEQDFRCENWNIATMLNREIMKQFRIVQESNDIEAAGVVKNYAESEREQIEAKITVSVVAVNSEVVENIMERCQDIVEGYVVWNPSLDQYEMMRKILFVSKSPSIEDFRKSTGVYVKFDRDDHTVTIPARSKDVADDVKEALLGLVENKKLSILRISETIDIGENTEFLVRRELKRFLSAEKIKISFEMKNSNKLLLSGTAKVMSEFKPQIEMMVKNIEKRLVISRVALTAAQSEFLRAQSYKVASTIEKQTHCVLRDTQVRATNDENSSYRTAVTNARNQIITVEKGDITKATNCDIIVNAANGALEHVGGVSQVIADAAGKPLYNECRQIIKNNNGMALCTGQAVRTTAGMLPFKCIIHAIGPQYIDGCQQERQLLFASVLSSLEIAETENCKNVALPAISASTYGFPTSDCTKIVVRAIKQFFANNPESKIRQVSLIDIDDVICGHFERELSHSHQNEADVDGDNLNHDKLSPLRAKWCCQDDRAERPYEEYDARAIEDAFQELLRTETAPNLFVSPDNLTSGVIVKYSIHLHPKICWDTRKDPNILNQRLICGYQMRSDTKYKRNIVRYPIKNQQSNESTKRLYKPLDNYSPLTRKITIEWTIIGLDRLEVSKSEELIKEAIESASISEKFSVNLTQDQEYHRNEIRTIAVQHEVHIDFQKDDSKGIFMIISGLKSNVSEVKLAILSYTQSILSEKVENEEDLKPIPDWRDQDEECKLVQLPKNNDEFVRVENRIKETMNAVQIIKIERVQNKRLWEQYAWRRRSLRRQLDDMIDVPVEMQLFHGTNQTLPSEIYNGEYGFDVTFSTEGSWGFGIYFAKNASYSCSRFAHKLSNGEKQVFLAQVLTGDVYDCKPDSSLRRPPKKKERTSGQRYNSISGETGGGKVYIIYENLSAYPTYLVTFK